MSLNSELKYKTKFADGKTVEFTRESEEDGYVCMCYKKRAVGGHLFKNKRSLRRHATTDGYDGPPATGSPAPSPVPAAPGRSGDVPMVVCPLPAPAVDEPEAHSPLPRTPEARSLTASEEPEQDCVRIATSSRFAGHEAKRVPFFGHDIVRISYLWTLGFVWQSVIRMFICVEHGIALRDMKQVKEHYNNFPDHKGATQASWKRANEAASQCVTMGDIRSVPDGYNDEPVAEIQGLPVYEAWKCPRCTDIVATLRRASEHLRSAHPKAPENQLPIKVFAQRWNQKYKFFLVRPHGLPPSTPNDNLVTSLQDKVSLLLPSSGYSSVAKDQTPFLRKVGWVEYIATSKQLHGLEASELRMLTEMPLLEKEPELARVTSLLHAHHERTTSKLSLLPLLVAQHILHHDPSKPLGAPFDRFQEEDTLSEYTRWAQRILAFLLRDKSEPFLDDFPLQLKETRSQLIALMMSDDEETADSAILALVQELLLGIWTHSWLASTEEGLPTDPTILFLCFSSIRKDGKLIGAVDLTPRIARIFYCMRLAWSQELISVRIAGNRTSRARGEDDCFDRFDELKLWMKEGKNCTLHHLYNIQRYASTIALTEVRDPQIVWIDRKYWEVLMFRGAKVEYADLITMFKYTEDEAVRLFKEEVIMGSELTFNWPKGAGDVSDNLQQDTPGYFFGTDPRNPNFVQENALILHVLSTPELRARFVRGVDEHGTPVWNVVQLRRWLLNYSKFEELLLLRIELIGGAPMRGTEICGMLMRNTSTRLRNLCWVGKFLTVITRYTKTNANTGREQYLPHAADAVTTDLLMQSLALARPFASLAWSICYSDKPEGLVAYRDRLFVWMGRMFESKDISASLKKLTNRFLGSEFGLNGMRHICIAIRRMKTEAPSSQRQQIEFEQEIEAAQAGHNLSTEQRVYAVSMNTMSNASDTKVFGFCMTSCKWQAMMGVTPGGLGLTFDEARYTNFDDLRASGKLAEYIPSLPSPSATSQTLDVQALVSSITAALEPKFASLHAKVDALQVKSDTIVSEIAELRSASVTAAHFISPTPSSPPMPIDYMQIDSPPRMPVAPISPDPLPPPVTYPPLVQPNVDPRKRALSDAAQDPADQKKQRIESMPSLTTVINPGAHASTSRISPSPVTRSAWFLPTPNFVDLTQEDESDSDDYEKESHPLDFDREFVRVNLATEKACLEAIAHITGQAKAKWRSVEQARGVLHTLDSVHDLIFVAGTGSGKTMAIVCAYQLTTNATVLVLPFLSLILDTERRFRKWGINFFTFTSTSQAIPTHIPSAQWGS
ncbi:hypothetical protein PQX77_022045 [Marasmius sp. AFHP31]|nr:hypothetical protein PQX77_022045 [Marasmius sp. AFHP31]